MNRPRTGRGDGIGLEFTTAVVRGVALDGAMPGRLRSAAEVGIEDLRDDRAVLDALIRVRAELGHAVGPTRVAMFPPGSTMHRIDVTGRSGPELNVLRSTIERTQQISSTVLIDDGPRRWMLAVRWNEEFVIRVEELVERAGFAEVTVDPSPVALARTLPAGTTFARRDAATDEAFDVVVAGVPVAAGSIVSIGRQTPGLMACDVPISTIAFDELVDPVDIVAQVERVFDQCVAAQSDGDWSLVAGDVVYPPYPVHDIRAPTRQCVALGAAVGAAGLAGRIRPIDMTSQLTFADGAMDKPWAIEQVSTLPPRATPRPVTPTKRLVGRIVPRRRR